MTGIGRVFREQKEKGNGALIGYVMGGDPEPRHTLSIADALVKGGVDILELGIPFSDPIADGPTIQAANTRALKAGTTPRTVMEMAKEIKKKQNVPVVLLTYYNPVFRMGLDNFFSLSQDCKVDGIVVPDLPVEESNAYKEAALKRGVDTIFLAAPSTSTERLRKIVACTSGFLYLVSHFGVTGEKQKIAEATLQLISRVLPYTRGHVPLAVGFGISKPEHARRIIEAGADGVIVGSAFVNIVQKSQDNVIRMFSEIEETARKLKKATEKAAPTQG